jgi:hypothetical protein
MAELMRLAEATVRGPTVIDAAYIEQEVSGQRQLENTEATVPSQRKQIHGNRGRSPHE